MAEEISALEKHACPACGAQAEWNPARIGLMVVGEEVPHAHLHVVPINHPGELSFAHVERHAAPEALDDAAARLRARLRELGYDSVSD